MKKTLTPQKPVGPVPETPDIPNIAPLDNPPAVRPKTSASLWRFMVCCTLSLLMGGCTPTGSGPQATGNTPIPLVIYTTFELAASMDLEGHELAIHHDPDFHPEQKKFFNRILNLDDPLDKGYAWGMTFKLTKDQTYEIRSFYNGTVVPGTFHTFQYDGSEQVILSGP